MKDYTNNYIRPEWIKKEETKKAFDLFEKILKENGEKYIIDYHCGGHHGKYFYSYYLIPKGTDLSYYGHPEGTIRLSNHWSWYSSKNKCSDPSIVQCQLKGISPRQRFLDKPEGATTPKFLVSIAVVENGIYVPFKY